MDILLTLVASILLTIGFFVICRSSDDEEEDQEIEESKAGSDAEKKGTV